MHRGWHWGISSLRCKRAQRAHDPLICCPPERVRGKGETKGKKGLGMIAGVRGFTWTHGVKIGPTRDLPAKHSLLHCIRLCQVWAFITAPSRAKNRFYDPSALRTFECSIRSLMIRADLRNHPKLRLQLERLEAVTHSFRASILGMHGMKAR
jgi:hypothetical protein